MFVMQFSVPEEIRPFYYNGIKTKYLVSNYGYVINRKTNHILKPKASKSGYYKLQLSQKSIGLFKNYRLHRLIAEVFIPNPSNKPQVNHKNGIKSSNMAFNLEWVTGKENMDHAKKHKLLSFGEKCHLTKYSDSIIHQICQMIVDGYSPKDISEKLNVPKHFVRRIRRHECRKNITSNYNMTYLSRDELINENNPSCIYSDDDIIKVIKLIKKGLKPKEINKITNVSLYEIYRIKNGKIRKSLITKFK